MPSDELKAAFINAHVAIFNCRVAGMQAENRHRLDCGNSIAYGVEQFADLEAEFEPVLGHNALIAYIKDVP